MRDPKKFIDTLTERYQFKLKGTGPLELHLGCDFYRDEQGVLVSYLMRFKEACITFRTDEPDYTDLLDQSIEWEKSV
jgi:hypothetical protein